MYTQQQLLNYLEKESIPYQLFHHAPLFTCEQASAITAGLQIPGVGIKNLFLKDDHKKLYIITATDKTKINLKAFGKSMGFKNLRFANTDLLQEHLGVIPGSVTPLALINDTSDKVQCILDAEIFQHDYIQIHPLHNNATVAVRPQDLVRFLETINRDYIQHDFKEPSE